MKYLTETDFAPDATDPICIQTRFYQFESAREDYFLSLFAAWDEITTVMFEFEVGDTTFKIPYGTYVCVGCEEGGEIDWMTTEEIIGKDIAVLVLNKNLKSWNFHNIRLISQDENCTFYVPMTKNVIPIVDENNSQVLISATVDQYHRYKRKEYGVFFI